MNRHVDGLLLETAYGQGRFVLYAVYEFRVYSQALAETPGYADRLTTPQ